MKRDKRVFSLIEVMVAISIMAVAAGALVFRINRLIEYNRFEIETGRLKNLLLSSRTLALNTHADWRLEFKKSDQGWAIQLRCLEDPDLVYPAPKITQKNICFNKLPKEEFYIDFFSTGLVRPTGSIEIKGSGLLKKIIQIHELFHMEENGKIAPFHPRTQ